MFEAMPQGVEDVLRRCPLPAVLVNVESDLPFPAILVDDHGGARQATRHLIEHGHRRITFFHGGEQVAHHSLAARVAGYRAAMEEAGLGEFIEVVRSEVDPYVDRLVDPRRRPTAIIAYIHHFAIDLLGELTRRDVRVPRDLSLITFNDVYPLGRLAPRLSTMALPGAAMGKLAAQLLLDQVNGSPATERRRVVLDLKLVERESVASPPAG